MSSTIAYTETSEYRCLENLESIKHMEMLDPLILCYCGVEQCRPGFQTGPTVKDTYLIHVVLSGSGVYKIRNREFSVHAGQAFLIRPEEEIEYTADQENPWKYAWIGFKGYRAASAVYEMGFYDEEYVIDLRETAQILEAIEGISEERGLSYASEMKRKSCFYQVLGCLMENRVVHEEHQKAKENRALQKKYVRRAAEYMMTSYNKKIRISDLAGEIGLNRSYLTNIFKQEMHMSPQDFLIAFRLKKAAQMLLETDDSIRIIAVKTGYNDSLSFSKAFKQKYDITPSEYRITQPKLMREQRNQGFQNCSNL